MTDEPKWFTNTQRENAPAFRRAGLHVAEPRQIEGEPDATELKNMALVGIYVPAGMSDEDARWRKNRAWNSIARRTHGIVT